MKNYSLTTEEADTLRDIFMGRACRGEVMEAQIIDNLIEDKRIYTVGRIEISPPNGLVELYVILEDFMPWKLTFKGIWCLFLWKEIKNDIRSSKTHS